MFRLDLNLPMKSHFSIPAFGLALILLPGLALATGFSSLEERMTGREFRDAGLHKLTEEELSNLNRWIQARSLAEGEIPEWAATAPAGADPARQRDDASPAGDQRGLSGGERSEIQSRLVGNFSGWRGTDTFELENGMVWQQAEPGTFSVPEMENPEVVIRPGLFGSWQLQVGGYNSRVRVRRVR